MNFCEDETLANVKLQISVVGYVVGFAVQVGDELAGRSPPDSQQIFGERTEHFRRDDEVFGSERVIGMGVL